VSTQHMKIVIFIILLLLSLPCIYATNNSAIVVLGCGLLEKKSTSRIQKAIEQCTNDTKYILFAGRGIENRTEADYLEELYFKYNSACLAIPLREENSYTTISNSFNVMNLLEEKNITDAIIVTSKNHFYAQIIFYAARILKNVPVSLQFSYSEYTNND
jgi:hypothetical protein